MEARLCKRLPSHDRQRTWLALGLLRSRIEREARLIARLPHPQRRAHRFGEDAQRLDLVMKPIDWEPLKALGAAAAAVRTHAYCIIE